jgi:hypothetical protein
MKNAAALLLVSLIATSSFALPPVPTYLPQALEGKEEYQAYLKDFQASMTKCASCHIPGADKKAKGHGLNDFGQAMHKHLDDKAFMAADKAAKDNKDPKETEKAVKLFADAWAKAVQEKNEDGKQFNELLKEGKLPGKNPPKAPEKKE